MAARREALKCYFGIGMSYTEIMDFLSCKHGIVISMRHLKRIMNDMGLFRRKHFSVIVEVSTFIVNELNTSGQLHGYRWMHLKCLQNGFVIQKEFVRGILQILDPVGVSHRKRGKLKRREYTSRGPNYIWHLDGYDKLKPFGICISGCIDGFSRHIIWMHASRTNNDPDIIAGYFCKTIMNAGGYPCILRGDMGTENSLVSEIQSKISGGNSRFLYGTSQHNQRIEAWWGILRKENAQLWMSLFEDIKSDGMFSGDFLDKSLIQFCFLSLVKKELKDVVQEWNTHVIRKSSGCRTHGGRPITLYNLPQLYDTHDYLCLVAEEELADYMEISNNVGVETPCAQDVFELATLYMEEMNLQSPTDAYEAATVYCVLRNSIRGDM